MNPQRLHSTHGDDKVSFLSRFMDEDGSAPKYNVHLNVSNLNGCFFHFICCCSDFSIPKGVKLSGFDRQYCSCSWLTAIL